MYNGKFITIEGVDGSGKSTTIKDLQKAWNNNKPEILPLKKRFNNLIITQEPGGSSFGNQLRKILLNKSFKPKLDYKTQAYIFATNRAYNYKNIIIPNLKNNNLIISDRGIFSSLAYQSMDLFDISNSNTDIKKYSETLINRYLEIMKINQDAINIEKNKIINDLIIIFDATDQTINKRINQRQTKDNNDKKLDKSKYLEKLINSNLMVKEFIKTQNNLISKNIKDIDANNDQQQRLNQLIKNIKELI